MFNLQGLAGRGADQRVQVRLQRGADAPSARTDPARLRRTSVINLSGSVANTGIAGQGASSGIAVPGGLVRANSAGNGRGQPYDPFSLAFADSSARWPGNHFLKAGADVRMIRMTHRPARRHHLHLRQRRRVPGQHAVQRFSTSATSARRARSTTARPARAHEAGVLRRLRAGRVARAARS